MYKSANMDIEDQSSPEDWLSDIREVPAADLLDGYDTDSVSLAKTNWYLGEWDELTKINLNQYKDHPDLAILATLKASGYQQLGQIDNCRKYVGIAKSLKFNPRFISAILIAGLQNSLGKIAAIQGRSEIAKQYFLDSVNIGTNKSAASLASHTRTVKQLTGLGLLPEVQEFIDLDSSGSKPPLSKQLEKTLVNYEALKDFVTSGRNVSDEVVIERPDTVRLQQLLSSGKEIDLVVAGMRHSGSTAVFNLLRLSLKSLGIEFESGYSDSEHEWLNENKRNRQLRLIKTHEVRDDLFRSDAIVVTTNRDLRDTVASASRRGFGRLKQLGAIEYAKYNRSLHHYWDQRSHYEFMYEDLMMDATKAASALFNFLGMQAVDVSSVVAGVNGLATDEYEETLLSPSHITDPDRILSYVDTLEAKDVKTITRQNYKWLLRNGYA